MLIYLPVSVHGLILSMVLTCLHDSLGLVYLYGCLDSSYLGYIANVDIALIPV